MNRTPLHDGVAVVVPCYNAAATVAETLESVIAERSVKEIVAIDDGSRDDTLAVLQRFAPRVQVLTGPNSGVSAARNRGIRETTAEWLLFLDSDDQILPGTLALRLAAAHEGGADVVVCDWEDLADDGTSAVATGPRRSIDWTALAQDAELAAASHVWAPTAALMYRRSVVDNIGGFRLDLPIIQDARFFFDAAHYNACFAHSPHVGARYRVIEGSLSRRNPGLFWQDALSNGEQIEVLWRAKDTLTPARQQALADIYNNAARGLFAAEHPSYFVAVAKQAALGLPLPRHSRLAAPLARLLGLPAARSLVSLVASPQLARRRIFNSAGVG
jgi:glycosyltransferase involved in cell wall biosynthesis